MSTNQTVSDKAVRPGRPPGLFKKFAALVLTIAALGGILVAGVMYSDIAQSLSSEPVYEATPEQVNPALEGKLVKMRITELVAEGGPLEDETFGLSRENAIALHRFYRPHYQGRINVYYNELHGVRKSWIFASQVKAGVYALKVRESFWENIGPHYINPDELTLPTEWKNRVVARTRYDITLRTDDTSNLAAPQAVFCYTWIPSPWRGVRHVVGRQQGKVLDLTGEGCGLIRGEEQYQQMNRIRPAIWEPQECWPCILALPGCIALCLLPAVWMVQKRGWLRALCVAALLGLLFSAMVAGALLLLPYAEHNLLTWAYTLLPCLLACILLCFACRKNRNEH